MAPNATLSDRGDYLDSAAARNAGYTVDQSALEEETGYKLEKLPQNPAPEGGIAPTPHPSPQNRSNALQTPCKTLQRFQAHNLSTPSPEDALLGALNRVFEESLAEAAAEAVTGEVKNTNPDQPRGQSGNPGQFASTGSASPREPETKSQHDRYGLNDITRLTAEPTRNAERAMAALDEVVRKRGGFVDKAAYRPECGWIRFDWGDSGDPDNDYKGGHGLAHIAAKHPDDLKHLPDVITKGEAFRHPTNNTKTYFVHGERFAVVASLKKGAKKTITEYAPDRPKEIAAIKKYPRAQAPGRKGG